MPTEVPIPIPLESPPVDIDVGGPVGAGVESACEDPDAASCEGIAALCAAESGAPCDPVSLPAQFPKEVDLDGDGENETKAEDALPDAVKEASEIKAAIPVDLAELLGDEGVSSPDQVKDISFDTVELSWDENSLTFDAPVLDVYVGPITDETDAAVLIADAAFTKVGTIGKDLDPDADGFEVGQEAGVADVVPLSFVEGGQDTFSDALKSFAFTLVVAAPDGQAITLKEVDGDTSKVRKPDGAAKLTLKAELIYTVDLAGAVPTE